MAQALVLNDSIFRGRNLKVYPRPARVAAAHRAQVVPKRTNLPGMSRGGVVAGPEVGVVARTAEARRTAAVEDTALLHTLRVAGECSMLRSYWAASDSHRYRGGYRGRGAPSHRAFPY